MASDIIRLLWISDNPHYCYVGQANVTREICNRLHKSGNYHIEVAGFNGPQDQRESIDYQLPYEVNSIKRCSTVDLIDSIHKTQPDVVLLSHDCWFFPNLAKIKQKFSDIKFIGYWTIDGEPISRLWKEILESCDVTISPTYYGREVIQQRYFHIDVDVVPYGIDHNIFYPVEPQEKKEIRNRQGLNQYELSDKFVFLYVGQNQNRKNLSCSVEAWKKFAKDKDDVSFILLTRTRLDQKGEWIVAIDYDLSDWIGIKDLVIIDDIVPSDSIPMFYQLSDIFLSPSIGEGFGLAICESMACGLIPVVTNFSGHTDYCENNKNSILLDGIDFYADWGVTRRFVDPKLMAEALEFLYNAWKNKDPGLHNMSQNAIITAKRYDWDKTADGIDKCIKKSLNKEFNKMNLVYEV